MGANLTGVFIWRLVGSFTSCGLCEIWQVEQHVPLLGLRQPASRQDSGGVKKLSVQDETSDDQDATLAIEADAIEADAIEAYESLVLSGELTLELAEHESEYGTFAALGHERKDAGDDRRRSGT